MKRFLCIGAVFLILTIVNGQTNNFHTFPDDAFWRVDMHCQYVQMHCNEYYYYHYRFGGDTLINSVSHIKIMRDSVILIGINGPSCMLYPWAASTGYMGALKQDSIANKVYLVWPNTSNDTLIYDYNLVIGDTIKGLLINGCTMLVSSVDSILIGTQYRRKWNFNTCNEGLGYIIQGIGSDNGLIEKLNSSGFCYSSLICVKDSARVLLMNNIPSTYGCQLIFNELVELEGKNQYYFNPNPFSSETTLKINDNFKNASLEVYNLYGQQLMQINNIDGHEVVLHRGNLLSGIYFVQLRQNNRIIFTGKILITDN